MTKDSGLVTPRRLSEDALAALKSGNVEELLRLSRIEFPGNFRMMADEDDDDDDDDTSGDGGDNGGDGDDDEDDSDDDTDSNDSAELEKLRKRMKAADKRASEAERKLQQIEDAKKDDLTKSTDRVTELETQVTTLQGEVSTLRLQNAFLTANKHEWHDPEVALSLASSKGYLEDVVDEDDGGVDKKALSKALDRLAKEHGYLVASKDKKDDEPGTPSGEPSGGRSDNAKDEKQRKAALRNRFPALNR